MKPEILQQLPHIWKVWSTQKKERGLPKNWTVAIAKPTLSSGATHIVVCLVTRVKNTETENNHIKLLRRIHLSSELHAPSFVQSCFFEKITPEDSPCRLPCFFILSSSPMSMASIFCCLQLAIRCAWVHEPCYLLARFYALYFTLFFYMNCGRQVLAWNTV